MSDTVYVITLGEKTRTVYTLILKQSAPYVSAQSVTWYRVPGSLDAALYATQYRETRGA